MSMQDAEKIREAFPQHVLEITEALGQVSVSVDRSVAHEILAFLHDSMELRFDMLVALTAVDYADKKPVRFEVVYQLLSTTRCGSIRIKAPVPEDDCSIATVTDIWKGANWFERECYDMFGITFTGHPELRRILMPEDWQGHPLRKDYPLQSDLGPLEWQGFIDVKEHAIKNNAFEVDECHRISGV
ncbi:MAG: NADH-quinone oxidoreductase subunit C [Nitrospiraceae bacterium]|jgi:NADH-quinone oxidoreductase subunit C|nr:NADH-quinone oxidoreductase subunit C [Nitrospiraceae bacterium]